MSLLRTGLWGILIISGLATIGSLYMQYFGDPVANIMTGELFLSKNGLPSCDLCWFIRICTYPLIVISLVGLRKTHLQQSDPYRYTLPFVLLGIVLCSYKYYLQKFAGGSDSVICTGQTSCGDIAVEYFGFMTLPFLGAVALTAIGAISIYVIRTYK